MKENLKLALSILWSQVASLFFILLLICAIVSFFLGERMDGIIITVLLSVNLTLGFFQEFKASKAGEKLLHLVQNKVYVFRNGNLIQILVRELVLGDVVHFVPGSVLPVDVEIIESENGFIDDSMRTGESIPKEVTMGEKIFAGAVVASGKIIGHVIALGENSSLSKYQEELESVKKWSSFSVFTERVIKYIFIISLVALLIALFLLVFVMGKFSLVSFFVFSIAMLVGVVPEVLPLIITLILTREALALSKEKVIVKRLSSLESLGAVRFLLTDKTGTITENKLKVSSVSDVNNFWSLSNAITEGEYERGMIGEAYDTALNSCIAKVATPVKKIKTFEPFDRSRGYELFTLDGGTKVARGLINQVLGLCGPSGTIPAEKQKTLVEAAFQYENKGMRVMAQAEGLAGVWSFSGFAAFYDPIKSSASESFQVAHEQGILVKILTGDTKAVAQSVAEELHLLSSPKSIISLEGVSVSKLTDQELLEAVVFAKCTPENKLELIERYIALGPVAFLGDGINDSLALKRADVGIAVDNASDIAKESSDIILLQKDLHPILKSVATGRKSLRNILTYISYTLAGNAGTFFSLLIASFFYTELPMLPIQILLNNLVTDLPLMLIITDNADRYALAHVPHFKPEKLLKRVFIFGLISSVFDLMYFQLYKDASVAEFQTGWFILSVLAELALILSIRSSRSLFKSPPLSIPLAIGIMVCAFLPFVFVYLAPLAELFKFAPLSFNTILVLFGIIVSYLLVNEGAKYIMRKRKLYNKPAFVLK